MNPLFNRRDSGTWVEGEGVEGVVVGGCDVAEPVGVVGEACGAGRGQFITVKASAAMRARTSTIATAARRPPPGAVEGAGAG